jgi:hypothetical protein
MSSMARGFASGFLQDGADAILPYRAGQAMTLSETTSSRTKAGRQKDQSVAPADELLTWLARQCAHSPSPWSSQPEQDLLQWSWKMQQWIEANIIQFVGQTLYDTEFLTMAGRPQHRKPQSLFNETVRQRAPDMALLFNSDPNIKQLGGHTLRELMHQTPVAAGGVGGGMRGMLGNTGGSGGANGAGVEGRSWIEYIKSRLDQIHLFAGGMPSTQLQSQAWATKARLEQLQRQQAFLDAHEVCLRTRHSTPRYCHRPTTSK